MIVLKVGMADEEEHVQRKCDLVLQDRASGAHVEMAVLYPLSATNFSSVMNPSV
jgi:hypothetical protein